MSMVLFRRFRSPHWHEAVLWALDLEASGPRPQLDEVLSVGMVPIRDGAVRWGERLYRLVRPSRLAEISEASIRVHGILPQELEAAPPLREVLPEVLARLAGGLLLVHHRALDVTLLRRACRRHRLPWPRPRVIDTQRLLGRLDHRLHRIDPAARPLPGDLAGARAALGLPPHEAHHALYDALATAELFLVLRGRLELRRLRWWI